MAVDSNFTSSLLANLNLEDPWLPPKPWERIPSESGAGPSHPSNSSPQDSLYDPSTISEVSLVRLALNALQGVEASLHSIETLARAFSTDSADRTSHRIPSLWYRSSSTNALGKVLKSIGRSGFIALLVRKFVDYFHHQNPNASATGEGDSETKGQSEHASEMNIHYASLVNQAFAVALGKVFQGFICALDTLYSSVKLRRSPENFGMSGNDLSGAGCLTSVVHSEITFMEVYLHTRELRTQIETIGNICMFKNVDVAFSTLSIEDLTTEATMGFRNFPKGADLLSYLYAQLRDADPAHHTLLKFLFIHSCEPYYGFVKSWIYEARIDDPYNEFIIEYVGDSPSSSQDGASFSAAVSMSSIRVRERVHLPCFLENFCLPLLRAGQQLQVLIKLLEMRNCFPAGGQTYDDILPYWSGASNISLSTIPPFTFSKANLEKMVLMRENMYSTMEENLQILMASLDNTYQPMSSTVMPFKITTSTGKNTIGTIYAPFSFSMEESSHNSTAANRETGAESETSGSVDDISYQADPFESSSECSSWNSSGEQDTTEETTEHDDSSFEVELRNLSASLYFKGHTDGNKLPILSPTEDLSAFGVKSTTFEKMDPISYYSEPPRKKKLSHSSEHYMSANETRDRFSKTAHDGYQSIKCWPLGGILKNPFCFDRAPMCESQSHLIYSNLEEPDKSNKSFEEDVPCLSEHLTHDTLSHRLAKGDIRCETEMHASSNAHITTSWTLKYNDNVFNMNPMLTKKGWFQMVDSPGDISSLDKKQSLISYFDFSLVEDPFTVYGKRLTAAPNHGVESNNLFFDSAVSSIKVADKLCGEQKCVEANAPPDHINTLSTPFENQLDENALTSTSGGAKWESTLSYVGKRFIHGSGDRHQSSGSTFDIPLDVIIEKCILQEILLQYEYISNFTIKLLEEGFDLQEHLLALRRYHFMEFADWADLFIMSLWRHKWSVGEGSEKISEIQGLLDLAVQRSSCVGDPYKERLYLYTKGHQGAIPFSTPANGVHAFDFIALGYKVDWPVSIVLTSTALNTYADIFSFLIQVKLAVFSLTDVWCTMKDLDNLINQVHSSGLDERDKKYINVVMRMRHQISHFVSTLQQYIQSELSHVSWCKLLHSLKHQVKDMFDLELVHMAYLADSLHICFLSGETQQVAGIIESILQCALDFRSCFIGGCWEIGPGHRDSAKILGRLNISQVLSINSTFVKNLKELYLCYLKSPKHDEFSLCRFWGYLNYNDYYSSVIGNGPTNYAL